MHPVVGAVVEVEGVGLGVAVGELVDGLGVGVLEAVTVGVGVGVPVGLGVAVGDGVAVGLGLAVGVGVGVGLGLHTRVHSPLLATVCLQSRSASVVVPVSIIPADEGMPRMTAVRVAAVEATASVTSQDLPVGRLCFGMVGSLSALTQPPSLKQVAVLWPATAPTMAPAGCLPPLACVWSQS
jgi:hypothetical protein